MSAREFRTVMTQLLKARFPILYVQTFEEDRLLRELDALVGDSETIRTPRELVTWSLTEGLVGAGASRGRSHQPAEALPVIAQLTEPTLVVMRDLHPFLGPVAPDPVIIRHLRDVALSFKRGPAPRTLVLVSPVMQIPPELEKDVTIVDFPLPTEESIRELLDRLIADNTTGGRLRIDLDGADREIVVKAARGLTLHEAENAFARAMVDDGVFNVADAKVVQEEKKQAIRKSGVLESVDIEVDLDDIGGLGNLKRWLGRREGTWLGEAAGYGLSAPKGVLITGVPGCGKSLTAKAVAAAWGLPLLRLDIGKVFSGIVGSSEHNMRRAIQTAEAVAPCVLWIDEIEKGFAGVGGEGDSGTSARVFSSFLHWMQEKQQHVFVIATANNIHALPPELLRKGRFDEIFFVDLPTHSERRKIWGILLRRTLADRAIGQDLSDDIQALDSLAELSANYSGAEIEQAIASALYEAYAARRKLTVDDLSEAVMTMVPLSTTQHEQVVALRRWADVRAVAATALEDRTDDILGPGPNNEPPEGRGGRRVDF